VQPALELHHGLLTDVDQLLLGTGSGSADRPEIESVRVNATAVVSIPPGDGQ
jgi:hypothetical protein